MRYSPFLSEASVTCVGRLAGTVVPHCKLSHHFSWEKGHWAHGQCSSQLHSFYSRHLGWTAVIWMVSHCSSGKSSPQSRLNIGLLPPVPAKLSRWQSGFTWEEDFNKDCLDQVGLLAHDRARGAVNSRSQLQGQHSVGRLPTVEGRRKLAEREQRSRNLFSLLLMICFGYDLTSCSDLLHSMDCIPDRELK